MWCRNSCEARGPKSSAMPKPPRKPNSNRHCGALPSVLLSRTFRKTSREDWLLRGASCICVRRGTRPPISTASRQSPSRSAVSSTRHRICCLVWTDPSPPDGSMHLHCEPYPANDKRYLSSVRTKKTASATHRTIRPSIRPDLNTICSSLKNEMGGKTFFRAFPL